MCVPAVQWTHMHGSKDGKLQQCCRKTLAQCQHKGCLLAKKLLHGILQAQVHILVALYKVWEIVRYIQKFLHLHNTQSLLTTNCILSHLDKCAELHIWR